MLSGMFVLCVCQDTCCRIDFFPLNCPLSSERVVRVCGIPARVVQSIYQLCSLLLYVSAKEIKLIASSVEGSLESKVA
jgi:hypothetical protein